MTKASPAKFADAKRRALRALGQQMPDSFVPDRVWFSNRDHGFVVRMSNLTDDHHVERIVSWLSIDAASFPIIEKEVDRATRMLAEAQGKKV